MKLTLVKSYLLKLGPAPTLQNNEEELNKIILSNSGPQDSWNQRGFTRDQFGPDNKPRYCRGMLSWLIPRPGIPPFLPVSSFSSLLHVCGVGHGGVVVVLVVVFRLPCYGARIGRSRRSNGPLALQMRVRTVGVVLTMWPLQALTQPY